jgi:undecaprenyl diphosphate synthase
MTDLYENFKEYLDPDSPESELLGQLDPEGLPRHIAVIMDGNGRWARQRGLPRVEGHRAGTQSVRETVEYSARLELSALTLYAFSSENWKRPVEEVKTLWALLQTYLSRELTTIKESNIRFRPIGRLTDLSDKVQKALREAEKETRDNTGMNLLVALSYGGRQELVDAFNRILVKNVRPPIDETTIEQELYTAGIPDPDLMIRTSGEMRISNFLLWQIAYSEIYVSDVLWPDFRGVNLLEALFDYQRRERRYGGILARTT